MASVLSHLNQKLTKNLILMGITLFCMVLLLGCNSNQQKAYLIFPNGEKLELELAITEQEQTQGLSDRQKSSFPKDRGMLFVYHNSDFRQFWMPDTHFDLAIIFLNSQLEVLAYENPVAHHPSREEPIPRTGVYFARYVLEIRSDSPFAQQLERGLTLKWQGPDGILEKQ